MKEVSLSSSDRRSDAATFAACLATILELPLESVPPPRTDEDPATGWTISRWLGGLGLGIVPIANPTAFSWPGPWIARAFPDGGERRSVVMFGVPSGVVWDPASGPKFDLEAIEDGFLIAAADVALALPPRPSAPVGAGAVEAICVASIAGEAPQMLESTVAIAGKGLEGDRHVVGTGTFPSGLPGSALTLIEAEVCESFDPPLDPGEHRRNVIVRGLDLNSLVGHDFAIGAVRCRGMRLCEPCTVVQRYASRPVLRPLVHRGGLRADILIGGRVQIGDVVRVMSADTASPAL